MSNNHFYQCALAIAYGSESKVIGMILMDREWKRSEEAKGNPRSEAKEKFAEAKRSERTSEAKRRFCEAKRKPFLLTASRQPMYKNLLHRVDFSPKNVKKSQLASLAVLAIVRAK